MKRIKGMNFWLGLLLICLISFFGMITLVSVSVKNQDWVLFGVTYLSFMIGLYTKI
ncbi:hypothetical protein LCGC14_1263170 [marine sediment metagenome]|uniref:Uncharacterized protein n=1 Tax=marine sediment metagenome TaxID=412755 RepID=A0A0F9LLG1_9ZZZZ